MASMTGVVESRVNPITSNARKRIHPPNPININRLTGAPSKEIMRIRRRPKRSLMDPAVNTPATPLISRTVRATPASQRLPVSSLMNVGRKNTREACINPRVNKIADRGNRMYCNSRHVRRTDKFWLGSTVMGIS